jgi:hypothetical protein
LFEDDAARLAELDPQIATPIPSAAPAAKAAQPAISFRNMRAVAISIGVAAATFLCLAVANLILPGLALVAAPILLAGAGFAAAVIYGHQLKQPLSGASGARLGWMTGLWFFIGFLIIATITVAVLSGPMGSEMIHQLESRPQFAQMKFPPPNEFASLVLKSSIQMFFLAVLFPMFGGIIGARYASRNQHSA